MKRGDNIKVACRGEAPEFTWQHLFSRKLAHMREAVCLQPGSQIRPAAVQTNNVLPLRLDPTGRLLDILRCQGQRGLQAFMESLEFYHPEQYTQLTGQQPTQRCSLILGRRGFIAPDSGVDSVQLSSAQLRSGQVNAVRRH